MNINELFPSKYAQPEDLKGRTVLGTINTVNLVSTHNPSVKMPVITFLSAKKPIILKQTLANDIAKIHGPETDNWKAQKIMLYTETIKGRLLFRAREIKPHEMPGYTRPENHRPVGEAFTPNQTPDEQEAEAITRKAAIDNAELSNAVAEARKRGAA